MIYIPWSGFSGSWNFNSMIPSVILKILFVAAINPVGQAAELT
jgi:hypothetical protein